MILLGRLCRCHYASNPAVSAAVRVACLSPFLGLPRASQAIPLLQAADPSFWFKDFQDSFSLGSLRPLSLCCSLAAHLYMLVIHIVLWWLPPGFLYSCNLPFFKSLARFPCLLQTSLLRACMLFILLWVTCGRVASSPYCSVLFWRAAPSHCLHASCYQCQGMSLCLMTEPLSGWRRLSG